MSGNADVLYLVREFYGLQALDALFKCGGRWEAFRHSHERWERDFTSYRDEFTSRFARMVFDYTTLVACGEARHAHEHCEFINPHFPMGGYRESVFRGANKFDPRTLLKAARAVYGIRWTGSGFGGRKWKAIAEAGLLYGNIPDAAFLDHCVDLTHNGSIYFDKTDAGIFCITDYDGYKAFLDHKYKAIPQAVLAGLTVSHELSHLVDRGLNIGLLPSSAGHVLDFVGWHSDNVQTVMEYSPIEWGNEKFPNRLVRANCCECSLYGVNVHQCGDCLANDINTLYSMNLFYDASAEADEEAA